MNLRTAVLPSLALAFLLTAPGAASAQTPAFLLPSTGASPGQEITIPVQFRSGGGQICAVSADASFDASKLAFVGAEAGPAGTGAGKNLVSQPMGSGAVRLALIGYNTIPIPDGVVFILRLRVQAAASGGVAVSFRGGAATCDGQDLPPFGATASVAVKGGSPGGDPGTSQGEEKPAPDEKGTAGTPVDSGASTATLPPPTGTETAETPVEEDLAEAEASEESPAEETEAKPLSVKAVLTNKKGHSPLKTALRAQVEGGAKPYEYAWDFGDDSDRGKKVREVHSFAKPGTYKPTLTVKDARGDSVTVEGNEILVQDPPVPELTQATLVPGVEGWSLELVGKKFQKGSVATVNGKEYATEFADAQRLVVKGVPDPKGAEVKVAVTNPYGKPCAPVKAAPKPEEPKAPSA